MAEISNEPLTFEKVWAMFQETDKKFQKLIKETREEQKETARQMKETDRQMKETDRLVKETSRSIKNLNKQIGGVHNSVGELIEHLVLPGIMKRFKKVGFHFDFGCSPGMKIFNDGKVKGEVDIMLENNKCTMAIEVKSKVTIGDIEHHIKRMEILRKQMDERNDKRKIYGTIAAAVFGNTEKLAAYNAGFFVLAQAGDTMKMDIPKNFIPKEW